MMNGTTQNKVQSAQIKQLWCRVAKIVCKSFVETHGMCVLTRRKYPQNIDF